MIAMEALDQLLMACHSQSIKPFVESFLHMVAKLLESREPDLQVLGTNSVRPPVLFCDWSIQPTFNIFFPSDLFFFFPYFDEISDVSLLF